MYRFCFIFSLFLLLTFPAAADVTRVEAGPQNRKLEFSGGARSLATTWTVTRRRTGGPFELRSGVGRFRVDGQVIGTTPARTQSVSGNPDTVIYSEATTIPESVLAAARGKVLYYERDFTDNPRIAAVAGRQVMTVVDPPAPAAGEAASGATIAPAAGASPPETLYSIPSETVRGVLELGSPEAGVIADNETVFRWDAVDGAAGYQLQVLDDARQQVYSAATTSTALAAGDFARKAARPKVRYQWRVAANDATGDIIAISAARPFYMWAK